MIGFVLIRDAQSYVFTNLVGPLCRAAACVSTRAAAGGVAHATGWPGGGISCLLASAHCIRFDADFRSGVGSIRVCALAVDSLEVSSGSLVHPGSSKLKWLRAKGPTGLSACFWIGGPVGGGLLPHSGKYTHRSRPSSEGCNAEGGSVRLLDLFPSRAESP